MHFFSTTPCIIPKSHKILLNFTSLAPRLHFKKSEVVYQIQKIYRVQRLLINQRKDFFVIFRYSINSRKTILEHTFNIYLRN
jgi:hypothetical protein